MNFYEKVIDLCQQKGVSRSKMADDVGISRSTPKDWADKKSTPQFSTIKKIADYFGVSPTYFTDDNSVNSHNTINGNNNIIGNGNTVGEYLTEQENALLSIFNRIDVIKQAQLLAYAAELEKKE